MPLLGIEPKLCSCLLNYTCQTAACSGDSSSAWGLYPIVLLMLLPPPAYAELPNKGLAFHTVSPFSCDKKKQLALGGDEEMRCLPSTSCKYLVAGSNRPLPLKVDYPFVTTRLPLICPGPRTSEQYQNLSNIAVRTNDICTMCSSFSLTTSS